MFGGFGALSLFFLMHKKETVFPLLDCFRGERVAFRASTG